MSKGRAGGVQLLQLLGHPVIHDAHLLSSSSSLRKPRVVDAHVVGAEANQAAVEVQKQPRCVHLQRGEVRFVRFTPQAVDKQAKGPYEPA